MRVFVTGASGHIGGAVVPELLGAGHQVIGLARSDASAAALESAGAEVFRGNLNDIDGLAEAAAASDGVIHLAFNHEWMRGSSFEEAMALDRRAVDAMGDALAGSGKPFVGTSGSMMLSFAGITDRPGLESDVVSGNPRAETEIATIALAGRGVRSSAIRLAPLVHSHLDHHGFGPTLIGIAREKGVSAYVGDGANLWPGAHTLDVARLYRLAVESAPAGTRLHGVESEGVPFKAIAEAIGRQLGVPTASVTAEEAAEHFGPLGRFAPLSNPVSNAATRELLGWEPTHLGLIADIEEVSCAG
jgi:nucleoside-diphosphate-sugar epimerase